MKPKPKNPVEQLDESVLFYVIFNELANAQEAQDFGVSPQEVDEIEQVMRAIVDVNDEPPQFVTST